jgi:hypothetical protein
MTLSVPVNNRGGHRLSDAKAVDPTLYKMGWLLGIAVGALTAFYRYTSCT